jgi:flagellin-like hook-associated protein FlgL
MTNTTRVSTFASNGMYISNMLMVQSNLNAEQTKVNTGMKSQDYTGLGDTSFRLVNMETQLADVEHYQDANKAIDLRLKMMQTSMTAMQDTTKNFLNKLTDYIESATGGQQDLPPEDQIPDQVETNDIQQWAWDALQQMKDYLNTEADGQYLFAGAKTQTRPVTIADNTGTPLTSLEQFQAYYSNGAEYPPPANGYPVTRDSHLTQANYYHGDNQTLTYRVDRDRELQVGINAADPTFEKAMRAMAMIAQGPKDTANGTHGSTGGTGVDVTKMSAANRQDWSDAVAQAKWLLSDALNADPMNRNSTVNNYTNNPPESGSDFAAIQRISGNNQSMLASITKHQTSYISFLNAQCDDIEKVNTAEAIVKMQANQRALEASYSTISMVKDLTLVKYL